MIEVVACACDSLKEGVDLLSHLFAWLSSIITKDEVINVEGHVVYSDMKTRAAGMILCEDVDSQKKIMTILQEPPGEFRGKYIARITSEEPQCVVERKEEEKDEEERVRKVADGKEG